MVARRFPRRQPAPPSAGLASRTNTLFSFPMLFFMGSASHLTSLWSAEPNLTAYWAIAVIVILLIEINALIGPGAPSQEAVDQCPGHDHDGVWVDRRAVRCRDDDARHDGLSNAAPEGRGLRGAA